MADSPPPNSTPQLATTIAAPATPAPTRGGEPIPAIPGFDILGVLGRGGMGVVYKAREIALDRVVALKMIHSPAADAEERARFQVEARAAAKLHHQGIVQVHAVSEHDSRPFLVLEYVEGGTLASKLKGKPVAPRQAAGIVEKLARAVQTAHEAGVVHRDLKPANVLVTARWEPKIADFGLAKCLDSVHLTQTGAVLGTPAYMAPEQAAGRVQDVGPASDVYSLGAILYELLTGKTPFQGTDKIAVLRQVQHERPTPVSSFASVSKDLETICLKCLEKRPDDRYNSAFALADDLARFGRGEPIHARRPRRRHRAARGAGAVRVLADRCPARQGCRSRRQGR
jgi:serine/threonine protein kinase